MVIVMSHPKIHEGRCPVCGIPTYQVCTFLSTATVRGTGEHAAATVDQDGGPPLTERPGMFARLHCGQHTLGELRAALGLAVDDDEDPNARTRTGAFITLSDAIRELGRQRGLQLLAEDEKDTLPGTRPCIEKCGLAAAQGDVYCDGCREGRRRADEVDAITGGN